MTQTYRTNDFSRWGGGQGFNLTPAQVDINFWDLIQRMIAQEQRPDPSAGIDHFSINGTMMYVHMTDGSVLGPYELPMAVFRDRGTWQPNTAYVKMDTFSINGGLWAVIFDHVSGNTFNPGASDGAGNSYYQLMIQTPGSVLPAGGAVGQVLQKTTTNDYITGWFYKTPTGGTARQYHVKNSNTPDDSKWDTPHAEDISYTPPSGGQTTVADALDQAAGGGGGGGRQTLWIPAGAITPFLTNGPSAATIQLTVPFSHGALIKSLNFDKNANEFAQFEIAMPKSWDLEDVSFRVYWSHAATTINFGVGWVMLGVAVPPSTTLVARVDQNRVQLETSGGTTDMLYVTEEFPVMNMTDENGGTPAIGSVLLFHIYRNAGHSADTLDIDARLHGVHVYYNSTGSDD